MSPVFGHGRLRLYLLKLLDESPKHGYEIIQQLKERFAGLYAPSAGTVYPRLSRMETEGLVRHVIDGGRKVYHITDAGRAELARRADELADLEAEIRASVNNLAEEIRDEVKESAQHVRDELRQAAQQLRRERQSRARGGEAHGHEHGREHGPHEGNEPWQAWDGDQGAAWRDWREQWKQQWARQWAEQWQDELTRLRDSFGAPFGRNEDRSGSADATADNGRGARGERQEQRRGGPLPGFEQLFGKFRNDLSDTIRGAMHNTPISEQQLDAAGEVLERTMRELRHIFERR